MCFVLCVSLVLVAHVSTRPVPSASATEGFCAQGVCTPDPLWITINLLNRTLTRANRNPVLHLPANLTGAVRDIKSELTTLRGRTQYVESLYSTLNDNQVQILHKVSIIPSINVKIHSLEGQLASLDANVQSFNSIILASLDANVQSFNSIILEMQRQFSVLAQALSRMG